MGGFWGLCAMNGLNRRENMQKMTNMHIELKQESRTSQAMGLVWRLSLSLALSVGVLVLGVSLGGCGEKPPEVKVTLGAVTQVRLAHTGFGDRTQVDAAGRSLIVRELAPIPANTSVELRGSKQHAQQLCVVGSNRCWLIYRPEQHDWVLLGLKP
jgi:hypothetical protein